MQRLQLRATVGLALRHLLEELMAKGVEVVLRAGAGLPGSLAGDVGGPFSVLLHLGVAEAAGRGHVEPRVDAGDGVEE